MNKIFPTKKYKFSLLDSKEQTMERLKRRTEYSESMTSSVTNKSFRGIVNDNDFKIISSEIGKGAFWVINGVVDEKGGEINLEINKGFKILFTVAFFLFFLSFIIISVSNLKEIKDFFIMLGVVFFQFVFYRFIVLELFMSRTINNSLKRFRDVLDVEFESNYNRY